MQSDLKKFTFFCAEHRLAEIVTLLTSLDSVKLLHVFEKRYKLITDQKDRLKRVVRHEIAGVVSESDMNELVHHLAKRHVYGFKRVTSVQFSDLTRSPRWNV